MEERLNKIISNDKDTSKISLKFLKEWMVINHPNEVDNIFDPTDTCFCSSMMRKLYRQRFILFYTKH